MSSERIQRRIERLLDQAEEAMENLDWGGVRDCAKAILGLDSTNSDALAFLASAEHVLGDESSTPATLNEPVTLAASSSQHPGGSAGGYR